MRPPSPNLHAKTQELETVMSEKSNFMQAVEELEEENDKLRALQALLREYINQVYDMNTNLIVKRHALQEYNRQIIEGMVCHDDVNIALFMQGLIESRVS